MRVPTNPQNSINVCQSWPLRANRDASIARSAHTRASQIAASKRSKPGPSSSAPGAAKIIVDDLDCGPAELTSAIGKTILPAPALLILRQLIGSRLSDVEVCTARKMLSRDLARRWP